MPLPRSTRTSPGCVPAGSSSSVGAVERLDGHRRAERRLDDRQVDLREDVVALAHEALVRLDVDEHVDVAGAAAERAGVAFAGDADALAVVDAGRDLDVERPRLRDAPRAAARPCTGARRSAPRPRQSGHACARTNSPKTLRETWCRRPLPSQRGQVSGCVPGSTPSPPQTLHGDRDLERHLRPSRRARPRRARSRSRRRRPRPAAAPPPRAPPPKTSSPKNAEKRSLEAADVEVRRREPAGAEPGVPVAVVERARLGVREHLVGLGHLAEADLGLRLARRRRDAARARAGGTPS